MTFAAKGLEPQTPAGAAAPTSTTGSIATNGERRDDWRFRAATPGSATMTATARTDADGDAVELTIPVLPYGVRRDVGASGALAIGRRADRRRHHSRRIEYGRAHRVSLARAVDGRLAPRRARLPHQLSVRLHRADALDVPAERDGDACVDAAEAGADRAFVGARSASCRRTEAPRRFPARRRRLGMVEDRREPPVHDRLRDLRAHRSQTRRVSHRGLPRTERCAVAGCDVRRVSARGAGSEGLHGLRAAPGAAAG